MIIILTGFVLDPFCKYMCSHFMSPYFFLMLQDKEQQSHSLPIILTYFIFVATTFRDFCYIFTIFSFILESVIKIHEKCGTMGVSY